MLTQLLPLPLIIPDEAAIIQTAGDGANFAEAWDASDDPLPTNDVDDVTPVGADAATFGRAMLTMMTFGDLRAPEDMPVQAADAPRSDRRVNTDGASGSGVVSGNARTDALPPVSRADASQTPALSPVAGVMVETRRVLPAMTEVTAMPSSALVGPLSTVAGKRPEIRDVPPAAMDAPAKPARAGGGAVVAADAPQAPPISVATGNATDHALGAAPAKPGAGDVLPVTVDAPAKPARAGGGAVVVADAPQAPPIPVAAGNATDHALGAADAKQEAGDVPPAAMDAPANPIPTNAAPVPDADAPQTIRHPAMTDNVTGRVLIAADSGSAIANAISLTSDNALAPNAEIAAPRAGPLYDDHVGASVVQPGNLALPQPIREHAHTPLKARAQDVMIVGVWSEGTASVADKGNAPLGEARKPEGADIFADPHIKQPRQAVSVPERVIREQVATAQTGTDLPTTSIGPAVKAVDHAQRVVGKGAVGAVPDDNPETKTTDQGPTPTAPKSDTAAPRFTTPQSNAPINDGQESQQPAPEVDFLPQQAGRDAQPLTGLPHSGAAPSVPTGGLAALQHMIPPPLPADLACQMAPVLDAAPDQPIELTLSPEELGRVRMVLNVADDGVRLVVQADRADTADLMRRHADQLIRDFRDMGYANVQLSFESAGQQFGQPQRQPAPTVPQTATQNEISASLPPDPVAEVRVLPRGATDGRLDLRL